MTQITKYPEKNLLKIRLKNIRFACVYATAFLYTFSFFMFFSFEKEPHQPSKEHMLSSFCLFLSPFFSVCQIHSQEISRKDSYIHQSEAISILNFNLIEERKTSESNVLAKELPRVFTLTIIIGGSTAIINATMYFCSMAESFFLSTMCCEHTQ